MSGFVAVVAEGGAPVDAGLVAGLTATMRGRAPDGDGVWADGGAGLGHALLATGGGLGDGLDAPQPVTLGEGVWAAADARVDAQAELRGRLRAAGRRVPAAAPDAALLLHAYAAWGERCAEHLVGDYAFAVWDAGRRRLVAARSAFGVRPLYWARVPGALLVGNTMHALLAHPACPRALDERWLTSFLAHGHGAEPEATAFAAVRRVPPGHTLVTGADLRVRVARHWTFPAPEPVRFRRAEETVERFEQVLGAAVGDRLRTRAASVYLSGGLDSTALAAFAAERLTAAGGALRGYTTVLEHLAPDDEGHYAALAARALGIAHTCRPADDHVLLSGNAGRAWPSPEPVDDPLLSVSLELAGVAAAECRVVLNGEDGDALLRPPGLRTMLRTLPWPALAWDVARFRLRTGRLPHLGVSVRGRLRRLLAGRPAAPNADPAPPAWLRPEAAHTLGLGDGGLGDGAPGVAWGEADGAHPLRPEMHAMLTAPLWPAFLESVDPGFTGLPVEERFPLLDERVIAFVASVPPVPWCQDKALLRAVVRGRLPEAVRRRPKTPAHAGVLAARLARRAPPLDPCRALAPPLDRLVDAGRLPHLDAAACDAVQLAWRSLRVHIVDRWLREDLPRLPTLPPACLSLSHGPPDHVADRPERRRGARPLAHRA